MQSELDFYFTIDSAFRAPELKVKGSRFIPNIFPVGTKKEIDEHLDRIRKEFYDATHHCYAFRLGIRGESIRAADDGEPSGTAGKPILHELSSKDLTDCLLVVTRYYGGTNLGTGGLARAYGEAARLVANEAKVKTIYLTNTFNLILGYEEIAHLNRLLTPFEVRYSAEYSEKIRMKVEIRKSLSEKFKADIGEKFYGRIVLTED